MDKWIIIHPTHLLPNPFMTQPAHLPPLVKPLRDSIKINVKVVFKDVYVLPLQLLPKTGEENLYWPVLRG